MLFVVRFHDHPGKGDVRAAHLQAHIDWMAAHQDTVLVGGSLRKQLGEVPVGGLWIVEAASREAVEALIATDPFSTAGLRREIEIYHWSKALEDRRVLV